MTQQKAPLEKELKYFLAKKDYDRLIRSLRKQTIKTVKQVNIYFDDNSLRLRKKKIGLRVRVENGEQCTLTVKEPSKIRSTKVPKLKVRHEWEVELPFSLAKKLIKGKILISSLKKKPIQVLGRHFSMEELENVMPLGEVKTSRTYVQAEHNVLLEIDKFKMFEQKFYELEVETQEPILADKVVRTLLRNHKIPYRPITKSKLGRFLALWKKERRR